jgi:hypothetical protein
MKTIRFLDLSKPRQVLIRLCQYVNYGSILNVKIEKGELVFDCSEVTLDLRLEGEDNARRELELIDFALPAESCRLLAQIDSVKDGLVEKVTVHDGIPRRVIVRQAVRDDVTRLEIPGGTR